MWKRGRIWKGIRTGGGEECGKGYGYVKECKRKGECGGWGWDVHEKVDLSRYACE